MDTPRPAATGCRSLPSGPRQALQAWRGLSVLVTSLPRLVIPRCGIGLPRSLVPRPLACCRFALGLGHDNGCRNGMPAAPIAARQSLAAGKTAGNYNSDSARHALRCRVATSLGHQSLGWRHALYAAAKWLALAVPVPFATKRMPLLSAAVACPRAGPAIGTSPLSGYCTHITRYPQLASGIRHMGWCPAKGSKPRDAPRLLQQP